MSTDIFDEVVAYRVSNPHPKLMDTLISLINQFGLSDGLNSLSQIPESEIESKLVYLELLASLISDRPKVLPETCSTFKEELDRQFSLLRHQLNHFKGIELRKINPEQFAQCVHTLLAAQQRLIESQENILDSLYQKIDGESDIQAIQQAIVSLIFSVHEIANIKIEQQEFLTDFVAKNCSQLTQDSNPILPDVERVTSTPEYSEHESPDASISALSSPNISKRGAIDRDLVSDYNTILREIPSSDGYGRNKALAERWSSLSWKRMSIENIEEARSGYSPLLVEHSNGNYFCIQCENVAWVFPIPQLNVRQGSVDSIFYIRNNGDYIESLKKEAQFEEKEGKFTLVEKGIINSESNSENY